MLFLIVFFVSQLGLEVSDTILRSVAMGGVPDFFQAEIRSKQNG